MKSVGRLALMAFVACSLTGCGGSKDGAGGKGDEVANPKYPDLFARIDGKDGHSGGRVWKEVDGGHEAYASIRNESTTDGTSVGSHLIYTGTSDAGDAFALELTIGDKKETKELVYKGEIQKVDVAEGVKYILAPVSEKRNLD